MITIYNIQTHSMDKLDDQLENDTASNIVDNVSVGFRYIVRLRGTRWQINPHSIALIQWLRLNFSIAGVNCLPKLITACIQKLYVQTCPEKPIK